MKAKIKDKSKEFQPVELIINIETEEQLRHLWHRFSIIDLSLLSCGVNEFEVNYTNVCVDNIWRVLDVLAKERGLKK